MPKIIVPVGRTSGPEYPADGGPEADQFVLEVGNNVVGVSAEEHQTWLAAFADVSAHSQHIFTRERLAEVAASQGVQSAVDHIGQLVEWGVFAEFEPGTDSALDFLRSYRLYPTADGLGNSPQDPSMFGIGRNGQAVLSLEHDMFAIWSGAYREHSMWHAVVQFDKARPKDAPFSTEQLAHLFAGSVPVIVATHAGFVDPL